MTSPLITPDSLDALGRTRSATSVSSTVSDAELRKAEAFLAAQDREALAFKVRLAAFQHRSTQLIDNDVARAIIDALLDGAA